MSGKTSDNKIKGKKAKKRWSAGKWLLLIAVLLVVFAAVPVVDEFVPRTVKVEYITFDGRVETEYTTRAHKVSEFVAEHGNEIGDQDMVCGLYEEAAMDPSKDDIIDSLKRFYLQLTGKMSKDEALLPYAFGFDRTAGNMRGAAGSEDNSEYVAAYEADSDAGVKFKGSGAANEEVKTGAADAHISNGMTISIKKAEASKAKIGGKKQEISLYPGDVKKTLQYNGIEWDEDDVIKPALDHELDFDDKIKITRVKIVIKEKKETIEPKEKDAVFDKSIASGTIVRTEGKPGKAVYKYTYKYINGKKKKTKKEFDHWVKKPTDIQLRFGTSVTGETGEVNFSETFTGNCTAYYFGKNAHGATGGHCHYGTCAVDPKVIPYGTKLYVEGYGTAVANDCGGAVKGHIIDLYMRSTKECFQWGRRNKKVYVLR